MEDNYRTIQIFLNKKLNSKGAPEVYEVSIHADGPTDIRCSCSTFAKLAYCTHSIKVSKRIEKNNGSFGLLIPENVPDDLAHEAFSSPEASREFILKYGKIEIC
jgi:hypothetical protein